ncbi:MAG: hypothetical protein ACLPJJ_09515 [Acidocella sp.]|uniref:hypothetical protein n=1 Tax=Acidocella sp. TaxID=50710 RepID=UPI003FC48717
MARRYWPWHLTAVALYAAAAWVVVQHGASLTGMISGGGSDPLIFIWSFAWWPSAMAHHLNPFFTHLVWQPEGLNLAWITSVPTLALLAAPVTLAFGPVLAFNLCNLAAPVLAACAAYALCLYLARRPDAALLGGFLFGFSSFETSRLNEQLNQEFICILPCLVLLALARLDGRVSRKAVAVGGASMLAAQAGISLEVFATTVLCGGFAWALTLALVPQRRSGLMLLLGDALLAAPLLLLLLSPLLWALFAQPHDMALPKAWPWFFSTDLLNFVIPTPTNAIGGAFFAPVTRHFPGFTSEQSGYLGLPLIILLWLGLRRGKAYLRWLLLGLIIASMGPQLWFGGRDTGIPLPWALIHALPLLGNALPARMMLYASLAVAVAVALWVAEAQGPRTRYARLALGALAAAFLWPAPRPVQPIPNSAFFAPGRVEQVLGQGAKVAILPFGFFSPSMYWQAESGFAFAQTGGYLGFPPARVQQNTKLMRYFFGLDAPGGVPAFAAYCRQTSTQFVVAGPGAPQEMLAGLRGLGWVSRQVDDVTMFTVPVAP